MLSANSHHRQVSKIAGSINNKPKEDIGRFPFNYAVINLLKGLRMEIVKPELGFTFIPGKNIYKNGFFYIDKFVRVRKYTVGNLSILSINCIFLL